MIQDFLQVILNMRLVNVKLHTLTDEEVNVLGRETTDRDTDNEDMSEQTIHQLMESRGTEVVYLEIVMVLDW
jgi:hypothetical protein